MIKTNSMSIRRFVTAASLLILYGTAGFLVACRREAAPKGGPAGTTTAATATTAGLKRTVGVAFVEQTTDARLGNHANPDGIVIEERNKFKPGEPLILSMKINQSPSGLQMSAVWRDAGGKILEQERKPMNGAKSATFAYGGKKLAPGDYTVTGYWGGNIAAEKKFKVEK